MSIRSLIKNIGLVLDGHDQLKILLPLCGKSVDLKWFVSLLAFVASFSQRMKIAKNSRIFAAKCMLVGCTREGTKLSESITLRWAFASSLGSRNCLSRNLSIPFHLANIRPCTRLSYLQRVIADCASIAWTFSFSPSRLSIVLLLYFI